jgi:spore coat protein U-like protein
MLRLILIFTITLTVLQPAPANATCIGVGCTCSASAGTLNFGSYAPLVGTQVDNSLTVSVTCSALAVGAIVAYAVALDAGLYGTLATRKLSNGTHNLNYNLYTDSGRTTIWGDGTGGTSTISDNYTMALVTNTTRNYTTYGRIFSSQNVSAGSYGDTITITVTF